MKHTEDSIRNIDVYKRQLPIPRAAHLYRRPIADLRVDRLAVGDGGDLLHPHPEQHAVLRRVGHR